MALLLRETLPELAEELSLLLTAAGHDDLAKQLVDLRIMSRCHCADDFCSTFYTKPKPRGVYGTGHENIALEPQRGIIVLDVVEGSIACVEVLYRDEIRRKLLAAMP